MSGRRIRFVLSDVDGTVVTHDKVLTERSIEAVQRLHRAGILFAVTSGRPPRGMAMLVEPLRLTTPLAAFNGGVIVQPDMRVLDQWCVAADVVQPTIALLESFGLTTWLYRGAEWYVRDLEGPHVARESSTVRFLPKLVASYDGLEDDVAKIVGVSDDHAAVAAAAGAERERFGDDVSASSSQPYYVDVTHPRANKGDVLRYLSAHYDVPPEEIAAIGDMPNDVLMFALAGTSIAMGQSGREVQRAARHVTAANDDDGFAEAVGRFVLRDGA
jgi:Cof subfamily protein (haloacid dehalogenase superfamily)